MIIVHISCFRNGGAGFAAWRLHTALREAGIESYFLSTEVNADRDKGWYTLNSSGSPLVQRVAKRILYQLNRLKLFFSDPLGRIPKLKRLNELRATLPAEYISVAVSMQKLHLHPLVKKADIIHLHWVANLLDYPSFFKNINKPVVWTLHDLNPILGCFHFLMDDECYAKQTDGFDYKIKAFKKVQLEQSKASIHFIAPSGYFCNIFHSYYKKRFPINQISYFCPPVTQNMKNISELRNKMGFQENDFVVLIVASDLGNKRKGFNILEKAVTGYVKPIKILAIGKEDKKFTEMADTLFTGFIVDPAILSAYYSLADVVVIPSLEDNLPNVMLEAFSAGTPVISFQVGGMKDHVIEGVTGLMAPQINPESLADTINHFMETSNLYKRETIMQYAETHFSARHIVQLHHSLYKTILKA